MSKRRNAHADQKVTPLLPHRLPEPLARSQAIQELFVDFAQSTMLPETCKVWVRENGSHHKVMVRREGLGIVEYGNERFWLYSFTVDDPWREYEALVRAPVDRTSLMPVFEPGRRLFVRIDSGCTTGQVFHDGSCECREQLHLAVQLLVEHGEGLIVRIPRQDGRGMGLPHKLATTVLQSFFGTRIFNTVSAARAVATGPDIDQRTYAGSIAVMKCLGVKPGRRLLLATQNDLKTNVFLENGFGIRHVSIRVPETEKTYDNLNAKRRELGHRA
jgi:GTP cyclohydrolase II